MVLAPIESFLFIIKKHIARAVLVFLTLAFFVTSVEVGVLDFLQNRAYDQLFRLRHEIKPEPVPSNLVIVAIDEPSMQAFDTAWPWPRAIHGELIRVLHSQGAAVIGFDILFSEQSNAESDQYFAQTISEINNIVLAETHESIETSSGVHETWIRPLELFLKAGASSAIVSLPLEIDGAVRRAFNSFKIGIQDELLTSFGHHIFQIYNQYNNFDRLESSKLSPDEPTWINYLGPVRTIPTVSYYQALEPDKFLPQGFFKDKIILVGFSLKATGELKQVDSYKYPFVADSGLMPGVEIHANIIDTLLRDRTVQIVKGESEYLIFAFMFVISSIVLFHFSHILGVLILSILFFTYWLISIFAFIEFALVLPTVTVLISLFAFIIMDKVYQIVVVDKQKRFISKAFKNYVPPAVVEQLIDDPDRLKLSGEYYETTVVFTDLVGFTSIAERMEPMRLRKLLTQYFTEMVNVMLANNGTLDKFIGDAMMCFFGVPIETPEHHLQAARTAWGMQRGLDILNDEWSKFNLPKLGMRIGVNTGKVVAGNMGTDTLFNYTIMGDCVNLGARLESANKFYGTQIMVGETTYPHIKHEFELRKLDKVKVKGKDKSVKLYEMLGPVGTVDQEMLEIRDAYETALEKYINGDFQSAAELFQALVNRNDSPAIVMLERCHSLIESPPDAWNGVYAWTSK